MRDNFQIHNDENEKLLASYKNFNQNEKFFLANNGVFVYFGKVFNFPEDKSKLPTIKPKLRRILVDYGLKTYFEINRELNCITIYYQDSKAESLRGKLLQKYHMNPYNCHPNSESVEIFISLTGSATLPKNLSGKIHQYEGLTEIFYQEFILPEIAQNLIEITEFEIQLKEIIKLGNSASQMPLESILKGELEYVQ